jgi:hypothetical protein
VQVDDTLNLFEELQSLHSSVATKTKTLHSACDQLVCALGVSCLLTCVGIDPVAETWHINNETSTAKITGFSVTCVHYSY